MPVSRYKRVVDALAADIRSGRLRAGTRLPTHRQLASTEGLALVTASRVYAELQAIGLVSGEPGRGTFVRDTVLPPSHGIDQQAVAADVTDLTFNYPALPEQADLLRAALRDLASSGDLDALLRYQPHGGRYHERDSVARHLARRGLTVDAERVLIVNGGQHGLAVTALALLQPGDVVAVDALSYPGFTALARTLRLELASLPALADATDLDALERLCRTRRVRAVYAMPTVHNPLGWVTTVAHRERLADIARRHELVIVEDAAYAYLADRPPAPLAALAPERTVYVSGLSKSVATGLRIGFVCAPQTLVPSIERAIRTTTWNTPALMTGIACRWLDDGTVDRLEASKRADAAARQAIAREVLAGLPVVGHPSSYFLWLPLPDEVRADRIAAALLAEHVSVSTAEPFTTSAHVPHAVRLALGSAEPAALRAALETVRRVVDAHTNL
ncbi:GntR family transcriptional regulator [Mycolicibacterium madagascariense]|uniref:GntR family transcriptional regulator n=1 Tax=Mycolicibacterium madagascariense TaxID=212765 RepID=A0A7I7X9J8_9MYCO|nr:PLP-dependent aminotransferase family protein [Mycolicibacterium madagascariense]MCV7012866.1 PLP-dependent aminotransferase family protein [Mycolicibacterium madagascariense]BBZ26112.1 GntR family transcriptional regulator [Mycolicibacterium madagascariense]